jgi:3-oxoacyl-[acyl-carrier protein] reductase
MGTVHGGIIATLLDSALGCAVQTALPDGAGRLLATATTTCLVLSPQQRFLPNEAVGSARGWQLTSVRSPSARSKGSPAMPTFPLEGRVAIVSGANHGIGAATAAELAHLGADVAVTYLAYTPADHDPGRSDAYRRQREQGPEATLAAVGEAGCRSVAIAADITDPTAPRRIFEQVERDLGPVSIVVNNASGWRKDSFSATGNDRLGRPNARVRAETADQQLLVDARGGALMIAELAASVREHSTGWGRIVSLTSGGPMGFPGEVSYGAAKAALESYTMSASVELADDGITANVVYPPVTDTGWITDEVRRFVADSPDHVHVADPSQVAEVIGWLCTDAANLVTGNILRLR